MASSDQESCHLCECWVHAQEFKRKLRGIIDAISEKNIDSLKTLLYFSEWNKTNERCESPLPLIPIDQMSCYFHDFQSSLRESLHVAFEEFSIEAAPVLIEKGLALNGQDYRGYTPLHICCIPASRNRNIKKNAEGVSMLLYYGADPMIPNHAGYLPIEMLAKLKYGQLARQEHLLYHTFDQYTESIHGAAFLEAVGTFDLQEVFDKNPKKLPKVNLLEFDDWLLKKFAADLFTMKPNRLQFLVDHFDYVVKELLDVSWRSLDFSDCDSPILIENFDILLKSKLKMEFSNWLCNVKLYDHIDNALRYNESPSALICFLLSNGSRISESDLDKVYCKLGDCEMFKILLHMDLERDDYIGRKSVMSKLLYNISLDVPKMIKVRKFPKRELRDLSSYFTIPSDLLLNGDCKDIQSRGQMPRLLEMARNVFRKYFIERLGIRNAGQFYAFIKLLPISSYFKAIITFERKLYY